MLPWKRNYYAILVAEFLAIAGFGTSTPILPYFLQDMGVVERDSLNLWVGAINFFTSFALAAMAPVWGKLSDSYGRKSMLLRAMYGGGIAVFLVGLCTSPFQVLVLRVFQGAVTGTIAAATVMVASIVPQEEVGFRLGLLQMVISLGNSLGPLAGGFMADIFGNRVTYFCTAGFLVLAGFIVGRWARDSFIPPKKVRFSLRDIFPDVRPLFESRSILVLVALAGLVQTGIAFVIPILPLYVQVIMGGGNVASVSGAIIGVSALSSAAASAAVGRVAHRFGGYVRLLFWSFFLAAVFHIPQAFSATAQGLLASRVFTAVALGMAIPVINILLAQKVDKARQGAIYGLAASSNAVGLAVGPMLSAVVAVAAGYKAVFFSAAFILAVSAFVTWKTLRED
jgi:DHA1 family multidrug resistance protein-like MFS transporter